MKTSVLALIASAALLCAPTSLANDNAGFDLKAWLSALLGQHGTGEPLSGQEGTGKGTKGIDGTGGDPIRGIDGTGG